MGPSGFSATTYLIAPTVNSSAAVSPKILASVNRTPDATPRLAMGTITL